MEFLGEPTQVIADLAKIIGIQPGHDRMIEGLLVYRYTDEENPYNVPKDYAIPYLNKNGLTASEVAIILDTHRKGK